MRAQRRVWLRIYGAVIRLHPAAFREEFGREMRLDYEEAVRERGFAPLLADAVLSVARQWKVRILGGSEIAPEMAQPATRHPFLAGQYLMVDRGHLTFFDWASASVLSLMLVLAIGYSASVPNQRAIANLRPVSVRHSGGIDSSDGPAASSAGNPGPRAARETDGTRIAPDDSGAPFHGTLKLGRGRAAPGWGSGPRASGGPPAGGTLVHAVRQLIVISVVIWLTSFLLMRSPGVGRKAALGLLGLLGIAAGVAFGQALIARVHAQVLHASAPLPSFEVATVKPRDPNARLMMTPPGSQNTVRYVAPARQLVAIAYNVATTVQQQVIGGPSWMDDQKSTYDIEGKIPEELYARMQTMTGDARREQACLMLQSLLAERFQLKVHFETREMPVYELTIAKGGAKLPPPNDAAPPAVKPGSTGPPPPPDMGGNENITQDGVRIRNLSLDGMLTAPWFGLRDRPIVNQTGLTGAYNLTLQWVPDIPGRSGSDGVPAAPDGQASIFTALEEQLGLKLVATKAQVEVVVIDHIERPSEN